VRDGLARNRANLAGVLADRGNVDGAIALYRENLRGDAKNERARQGLASVERTRELLTRLPGVLSGAARPANPTEAREFAELCARPFQGRFAAAARLYGEAFAADPEQAARYRYDAACSAARAARGDGADAPADPAERSRLRATALGWLRAELAVRREQAAPSDAAGRKAAAAALAGWLKDPDLSGTRSGPWRIGTPGGERAEWDAFWAAARAALAEAVAPPPSGGSPPPERGPGVRGRV
jgi:hypothetical protein